jgi:exopolysaccharide biosynthesis polyprenyl glycosylphosphotransferase
MARSAARFALLTFADIVSFLAIRGFVRALRDDAIFGAGVAHVVELAFPVGILGGLNFGTALVLGLVAAGAYGRGDARRDLVAIAKGVALAVVLALWVSFWEESMVLALLRGSVMLVVLTAAVGSERLIFDGFLKFVFKTPADGDPMVFVGDRSEAESQRIHDGLLGPGRKRATTWVHIPHGADASQEPPAHVIERVHDALSSTEADTLVLCGEFGTAVFEAIVEAATSAGVRTLAVARVSGVVQSNTGTVRYDGAPFVELTVPGIRGWQLVAKRLMDVVVAAIGLLLLSPLFALIAVIIKRGNPGPVFFRQSRVGYAGKEFKLLKFRTMRADADALKAQLAHLNTSGDRRLFKIPNDPRVTPVGRFLRRWSLDELPQLFNVLVGQMSLVGPRPFFASDLAHYLDHHYARLGAKPGISGLWQVKGRSSVTDFEEVVRLDREYIERWSVFLDLAILLRTLPAVIRGRGAY